MGWANTVPRSCLGSSSAYVITLPAHLLRWGLMAVALFTPTWPLFPSRLLQPHSSQCGEGCIPQVPEGPSSLSGPLTTSLPLPLQLRLWLCGHAASWHHCLGASVSPRPKAVRQEPPPRPRFPVDQLTELLFTPDSLLCPEGHESTKGEAKVGPTHPGVREGLRPPPTEPGPKPRAATSSGSLPQYQVRHTYRWARGDQQFREPRRREPAHGPRSFHHRLTIPRIGPLSAGRQGRVG